MAVRSRTSSDLSGPRSQKERLLQKVASEVWNTLSLDRFMLQVAEGHRHNARPDAYFAEFGGNTVVTMLSSDISYVGMLPQSQKTLGC